MDTKLWKVVCKVHDPLTGSNGARQVASTAYADDAALIAWRHGPGTVVKWRGKITALHVFAGGCDDPGFEASLAECAAQMQRRVKDPTTYQVVRVQREERPQ